MAASGVIRVLALQQLSLPLLVVVGVLVEQSPQQQVVVEVVVELDLLEL